MLVVYRGHIANHILSEHGIGAWKLSQLTPSAVGKFRDRLRNAGVTVPTTRKVLATLHGVLATRYPDWIATNAARNVKVIGPRGEGSQTDRAAIEGCSLRALIDAAGADLGLMLIFAASTGARAVSDGRHDGATWTLIKASCASAIASMSMAKKARLRAPRASDACHYRPTCRRAEGLEGPVEVLEVGVDLVFANAQGGHIGHDNLIKRRFLPLFDAVQVKR